jgi:hypothetical protein
VPPLAPAPDAAALSRADTALKLQVSTACGGWCWLTAFAPKLSDIGNTEKG